MITKKEKMIIDIKINRLLKFMGINEEKDKKLLDKELALITKKHKLSYDIFVRELLAKKVSVEKEPIVEKIIEYIHEYNSYFNCMQDENGNIPLQTAIETGYSTDFICSYLKKYFNLMNAPHIFGSNPGNFNGDTILHTVLKNCIKNKYDVFEIFYAIKNLEGYKRTNSYFFPYKNIELFKNNDGETIIDLINQILDKKEENVIEFADVYKVRRCLRNTKAYFYNLHFDLLLNKINSEYTFFPVGTRIIINNNLNFYGEVEKKYRELGLESVEGLLNLCVSKHYDEKWLFNKIVGLVDSGVIDPNYINSNNKNFITLALENKYSYDFIKKMLEIDFHKFELKTKNYIMYLRDCMYYRSDIDCYDFYKFLCQRGLNLWNEESIFFDTYIEKNIYNKYSTSTIKLFKTDYTIKKLKKLKKYLNELNLKLNPELIGDEFYMALYSLIEDFETLVMLKTRMHVKKIDYIKMMCNVIYENRVNSINVVEDDVTKEEILNSIKQLTKNLSMVDFEESLILKDNLEQKQYIKK